MGSECGEMGWLSVCGIKPMETLRLYASGCTLSAHLVEKDALEVAQS